MVSGLASLALVALPASDLGAQKAKYETIKINPLSVSDSCGSSYSGGQMVSVVGLTEKREYRLATSGGTSTEKCTQTSAAIKSQIGGNPIEIYGHFEGAVFKIKSIKTIMGYEVDF